MLGNTKKNSQNLQKRVRNNMTKEKLEEYLSNLNLNYYNEEELQKIYDAVKSTVDQIEENIGREA